MAEPREEGDLLDKVRAAAEGNAGAWRELLDRFQPRLRRMVALRLDPRLTGRIDPSDVLQEAYIDAGKALPGYVTDPKYPFFLWLRLLTGRRLNKLHRFHLGQQTRDATRDVSLFHGATPEASSTAIAAQLIGRGSEPAEHAARVEFQDHVMAAVSALDPIDREVLALRHFEQLTTFEAAQVLGISPAAAGKRYVRALQRLRGVLGQQVIT